MELTGKAMRFYVKSIGSQSMVACSSSRDVSGTNILKMKLSKIQILIISIFLALTFFGLFGYRYAKDLLLAYVIKSDLSSKDELVTYLTTSNADWDYVQKSLGGLKMSSVLEGKDILLKANFLINKPTHINSMHCIRRIKAKQSVNQIRIQVQYCLCNKWGAAKYPYTVNISKPVPGEYTIVYKDRSAGYPIIGQLTVH